mgnify:CR=1 FL=1
MGETIGTPITFTTGDAVMLGEAGQLRSLLGKGLYTYTRLSIAGSLNGDDLRCLREMMGRGLNDAATAGRLSDADLTDARIVAGATPTTVRDMPQTMSWDKGCSPVVKVW